MKEDDKLIIEFKAVLFFILDLLENGNVDRAIKTIKEILKE